MVEKTRPIILRRSKKQWRSPLRSLQANVYDLLLLLRESRLFLLGFIIILTIGTSYFYIYGADKNIPRDIFHTLQLLAFQSNDPFPSDTLGEILYFMLPIFGITLILQSVVNFSRLLFDKSGRREIWQRAVARTYHQHIIVCGLGRIGYQVLQQLRDAGEAVVALDAHWDGEFVSQAVSLNIPVITGDARDQVVLHRAGIASAKAIIVAINDDVINIEVALTIRAMNTKIRTVIRMFNDNLDANLEEALQPLTAFSASALASPTFAAAAVSFNLEYVMSLGEHAAARSGPLGVRQITLTNPTLLDTSVTAIEAKYAVRVIQHFNQHNQLLRSGSKTKAQHTITVVGVLAVLEDLHHYQRAMPTQSSPTVPQVHSAGADRIIICGLGRVSYRVIKQLKVTHPQSKIVVVHMNAPEHVPLKKEIKLLYPDVELYEGDARDMGLLEDVGLSQASAVAALTSDDLVNLQVGMNIRRVHKHVHLVLRIFSDVFADKLKDLFGINTAYSIAALAGPTMAAAAIVANVRQAFDSHGEIFASSPVTVKATSPIVNMSVQAIRQRWNIHIVAWSRADTQAILPAGDMIIKANDEIVLLGTIATLTSEKW